MLSFQNITQLVAMERVKIQHHLYDMLTVTFAHDMRTPLNALLGLLSTLQPQLNCEGERYLRIIESQARSLLMDWELMQDFIEIRNGRFKIQVAVVPVKEWIE